MVRFRIDKTEEMLPNTSAGRRTFSPVLEGYKGRKYQHHVSTTLPCSCADENVTDPKNTPSNTTRPKTKRVTWPATEVFKANGENVGWPTERPNMTPHLAYEHKTHHRLIIDYHVSSTTKAVTTKTHIHTHADTDTDTETCFFGIVGDLNTTGRRSRTGPVPSLEAFDFAFAEKASK